MKNKGKKDSFHSDIKETELTEKERPQITRINADGRGKRKSSRKGAKYALPP